MTMSFGPKVGAFVAVFDILKAMLAFLLACYLFPAVPGSGLAAGLMAVMGHMFPFWMGFHGGKGFASLIGVTLCVSPWFAVILLLTGAVAVLATDHIVTMTFLFIIGLPAYLAIYRQEFLPAFCGLLVSIPMLLRHVENIRNIRNGQEPSVRKVLFKKAP